MLIARKTAKKRARQASPGAWFVKFQQALDKAEEAREKDRKAHEKGMEAIRKAHEQTEKTLNRAI
ncbi:MAG: hypothetical protein LBG73_06255, partial [Spirochaetaceae bacterium]|nr:hypothetical protein [Spirochaetaceae bacterium]